ncbi:hypothetical protein D9615_001835 [Tricholomella constricta]|uniref:Uncharacterized protein n=1 Tax=Tricholomella constricta TaxID=117010 RepID=A0A8H5MAF3_9AGAR|nr:hypothetical protein D9615_001835 [Tricholomella constricta]
MAGTIRTGTMKSSFSSILPAIRPSKIKRKHLRKYSWLPDVFRLKGSIVGRIVGPVLTITLFAALIAYAKECGYRMVQTNSIVPLLSVVVGLLLVFRPSWYLANLAISINSTSYDRYWEGRKSFASLTSSIRNLSRQVWVSVALPPTDAQPAHVKGKTPTSDITASQLKRRKIEALKLSLSFAYAVKHYLRGEDGIKWDDFYGVLPASFARYDETGFNIQHNSASRSYSALRNDSVDVEAGSDRSTSDGPKPDATKRVRPKRSKQQLSGQATPLLSSTHRTVEFHAYADEASLPLPLVIASELTRILFNFRREGFLETVGPAGTNAMMQLVSSMVDQLTAMERVANTPIPISYGIHLKQCVTLYLFALPLTLVNDLGWATVPIVTVVAFTFMGIEGIADEIEMPFGTDERDLPIGSVDRYCQDLKEEINYIIERLPEGGEGQHGYDDGEGDD